jgi:hypothetical protein
LFLPAFSQLNMSKKAFVIFSSLSKCKENKKIIVLSFRLSLSKA